MVGDLPVVIGIGRLAGPDLVDEVLRLLPQRHRILDRPQDVAYAIHDVQGKVLAIETGVVLLVPVVQLPDRLAAHAVRLEPVPPAWCLARVRRGVVPAARLVDLSSGREARARRYADGRAGVGVLEERATGSEPVEDRRFRERIAV